MIKLPPFSIVCPGFIVSMLFALECTQECCKNVQSLCFNFNIQRILQLEGALKKNLKLNNGLVHLAWKYSVSTLCVCIF